MGLFFYFGISVGDEKELVLYVGINMDVGLLCCFLYRLNDLFLLLVVLLKLGFGLWGFLYVVFFMIVVEFNLVCWENVFFIFYLKFCVGSFSFCKYFLSMSGSIGGDYCSEFWFFVYGERNMDVGV